jgi:poly(hydroxyalkanoate) depolymerase family esterase
MPVISPRLRLRRPRNGLSGFAPRSAVRDRLSDLAGFGDNPGNLRGRFYVPKGMEGPAPLVVVLHGCTQDAAVYDHGSGWSTLADRHGFALLFPEQQRANNSMLCFNWFSAADTQRGKGEAASIRAMIEAMGRDHEIDPERIFVTGLSAGGAMASVMLATYPELFAGGAILAGVAYGCADNVGEAFECMGGRARSNAQALSRAVRAASRHEGPWPRVQVWQGSADQTVVPSNAEAIVLQWAGLHGLGDQPHRIDEVDGHPRRVWLGEAGEPLIEQYTIAGMAHGVPLDAGAEDALGQAGAHMLDVGLSSTQRIAEFFGIAPQGAVGVKAKPGGATKAQKPRVEAEPKPAAEPRRGSAMDAASGPQAVIEKALRAAGLMR